MTFRWYFFIGLLSSNSAHWAPSNLFSFVDSCGPIQIRYFFSGHQRISYHKDIVPKNFNGHLLVVPLEELIMSATLSPNLLIRISFLMWFHKNGSINFLQVTHIMISYGDKPLRVHWWYYNISFIYIWFITFILIIVIITILAHLTTSIWFHPQTQCESLYRSLPRTKHFAFCVSVNFFANEKRVWSLC